MIGWLSDRVSSPKLDLAITAIISGTVVGITILGIQKAGRTYKIDHLKHSIPALDDGHDVAKINAIGGATYTSTLSREDTRSAALAARARVGDYDNDLILEQLARNRVFLTDHGLAPLRNAFIVIVGCGGVGSHAAAALARSGAGKLRLIDFDQVTLSSLNRHSVATLADVGTPKVACLRRRLEQITPWTLFDCRNQLFGANVAADQLAPWDGPGGHQRPDYVIDAIDNIDSKVELLHYCHTNNLRVISSMGAGCKSDPTKIFIGDIAASTDDPLSRATRRRLRLKGVSHGIPCVYSQEKPAPGKAELQPLPEAEFLKGSINELGILPDFRVRILPVLGSMPAIFGLTAANHVILDIAAYPLEYASLKGRDKLYDAVLTQVQSFEERLARTAGEMANQQGLRLALSAADVGYLIEEVFRGKSVVSGLVSRLALVRWTKPVGRYVNDSVEGQKSSTLRLGQLVCMTKEEAQRHEKLVLRGDAALDDIYDADVRQTVEKRMAEEKNYSAYR